MGVWRWDGITWLFPCGFYCLCFALRRSFFLSKDVSWLGTFLFSGLFEQINLHCLGVFLSSSFKKPSLLFVGYMGR